MEEKLYLNGSVAVSKKLSEMSMEELWKLFPIFLTRHQDFWKDWYMEEERFLKTLLPQKAKINHIGSTQVQTIWAKPIIDILVEVPKENNLQEIKTILENSGYICMATSEERISFNKGYTETGFAERVFHLHLRYAGDNDELYFRDYLNEYPEVAGEYEKMKLSLWKKYEFDRDNYTDAKSDFVKKHTVIAKSIYGKKY